MKCPIVARWSAPTTTPPLNVIPKVLVPVFQHVCIIVIHHHQTPAKRHLLNIGALGVSGQYISMLIFDPEDNKTQTSQCRKTNREYLCYDQYPIRRKKTKEDEHQSSLDSFANADLPTMPDLDNLTKADKIIRQEKNESKMMMH